MQRIAHGSTEPDSSEVTENIVVTPVCQAGAVDYPTLPAPPKPTPFYYMFEALSDDEDSLILQSNETLNNLSTLGQKMHEKIDLGKDNSPIPSFYTYFGQFIDHDVVFTNVEKPAGKTDSWLLNDENLAPWNKAEICSRVRNKRASLLDLDCVYGPIKDVLLPPLQPNSDKFALCSLTPTSDPIETRDGFNDVPRGPKSDNGKEDRVALIADRRNDSHLIISQLHVAFLRAHNEIVDRKQCSFEEARRILQMHYQWLVTKHFLPAIVSQSEIDKAMNEPIYKPAKGLPYEFAVGAYRFGHSMVRNSYYYNKNYPRVSPLRLFTLILLSGGGFPPTHGKGFDTLPAKAVIDWKLFLNERENPAKNIGPKLSEPLFTVLDETSIRAKGEFRLSVLDLKRSYMMRIPTGQAIAKRLGLTPLTPTEIESVFPEQEERDFLRKTTLSQRTPLFFYVLAEAALSTNRKLGPVGGRIVAEVLIGLVRSHKHSVLNNTWTPDLGKQKGEFSFSDLLRLGNVLEP